MISNRINPNIIHQCKLNVNKSTNIKLIYNSKYHCSNSHSTFSERYNNRNTSTKKIKLEIGDYTQASHTYSLKDVELYSQLTGDTNAVHNDASVAKEYGFNNAIVHGMFTASLFATAVGANLPGSILVSKNLRWKLPVEVGQTLNATVTVKKILKEKKFVICDMVAKNENNHDVVFGEVTLLIRDLDTE